MQKLSLFLFLLLSLVSAKAQLRGVTENGSEVILFDNGTWVYADQEDLELMEIPLNKEKFKKNDEATFLVKSKVTNVGFWIDPKKWTFNKSKETEETEFDLELKGEDLYGMIITEQIEIPLEALKPVVVENARDAAPDIRVVKEEYRNVNGIEVLMLEMHGTMSGIKFAYIGYYFSFENGTVQFVTYTSQNLLSKYRARSEELLNGLVVIE